MSVAILIAIPTRGKPAFSASHWTRALALAALLAPGLIHGQTSNLPHSQQYESEEQEEAAARERLLKNPVSRPHGLYQEAEELFKEGKAAEARKMLEESIALGGPTAERMNLLATMHLERKDTATALAAFEKGWALDGNEGNFVGMMALKRFGPLMPVEFLKRNMESYAGHPAAIEALYHACEGGKPGFPELLFCLELSDRAQRIWWPQSVDWKMRHVRILSALGRRNEMHPVLMEALELMDSHPDFHFSEGSSPQLRKEIFSRLQAAGRPR